jgi:hypothetical protein
MCLEVIVAQLLPDNNSADAGAALDFSEGIDADISSSPAMLHASMCAK